LLVCNHVSHLDALLVFIGLRRKVRFVVWKSYMEHPFFRWLYGAIGAWPVGSLDDPLTRTTTEQARAAMRRGEAVCIFAEGAVGRTSSPHPFKKWYEALIKDLDVPIVPLHLDNLSGGLLTYRPDGFHWNKPALSRTPTILSFGKPLPARTPVERLRLAVMELGSEAWDHRRASDDTVARRLLSVGKARLFQMIVSDTTGSRLTYLRFLTGAFLLARWLRERRPEEGTSASSFRHGGERLANAAVTLAGRTVVNLNFTLGEESMKAAARQAALRTILTSRVFLEKAQCRPPRARSSWRTSRKGSGESRNFPPRGDHAPPGPRAPAPHGRARDQRRGPLVIVFSSGSTSVPKGIVLTHHNILSNVESFSQVYLVTKEDAITGILPFFHSFGYTVTLWFRS
jgi:acyl-[acyl-carrier-protein]-phospholipid O-acyltransferase/long-chain-fatty-acid--[acyl-carrier-protein] ligase